MRITIEQPGVDDIAAGDRVVAVDVRLRRWLSHEKAVLRRASGVNPGLYRNGAGRGRDAFAAMQLHIAVVLLRKVAVHQPRREPQLSREIHGGGTRACIK